MAVVQFAPCEDKMPDIEHGFKWWIRYVIVPLIGGGGAIAIVVAIINRPSPSPPQIVRGPAYNEGRTSNPGSPGPNAPAQETKSNPARTQTVAHRTTPEQAKTPMNQTANVAPPAPRPAQVHEEPAEAGVFVTGEYRMKADPIRKVGDYATISLTLESLAEKPVRFVMWSCYMLDENGSRWNQQEAYNNQLTGNVIEVIPGTRVKSEFKFNTTESNRGSNFTFICTETLPQNGRHVVIRSIPVR
jgi:hypothetical protein